MLGNPLTLRLSPEKHAQYEDEAARRGQPLGTYLRERLAAGDTVRDELAAIRRDLAELHHMVENLASEGPKASHDSTTIKPVMLEMLLLLRALAGPDKLKIAQGELKRVGLQMWIPEEAKIGQ